MEGLVLLLHGKVFWHTIFSSSDCTNTYPPSVSYASAKCNSVLMPTHVLYITEKCARAGHHTSPLADPPCRTIIDRAYYGDLLGVNG